jgi:hypothetical protein
MVYAGVTSNTTMHFVGVVIGVLFILFGALMTYFFVKHPKFFGEFKNKFTVEIFSQLFYLLYPIERMLNSIFLVTLFNLPFQNGAIILIFCVIFIMIYRKEPYIGKGNNIRPLINQIIIILIQAIFLAINMINSPKSILSIYGPLII